MTDAEPQPVVIQGGMGAAISNWRLARAVSLKGQLGVVSGTGIDSIFARRLQDGDQGGHMRRAMAQFPIPGVAADALRRFFLPEGRVPGRPYSLLPLPRQRSTKAQQQLTMLAAFVEVWLAKEGHAFPVGMNLLTKVQMPTLATLYGAMLAGVEIVLMGAGIPREIPGALDAMARHEPAALRFEVEGLPSERGEYLRFDPRAHWTAVPPPLERPRFYAIIASNLLATVLSRKASGHVDGFVVEGPTAGGHNAPPRGEPVFTDRGEPVYGERDVVDIAKMRELGVPFWLAGGTGHPGRLIAAIADGAAGVQVGTLFAFCDESGLEPHLKTSVLEACARGEVEVRTDARISPTGYPFKVVEWSGDPGRGVVRERLCDLGYLRVPYARPDGRIGYRCPGEPVDSYLAKGGKAADTAGRRCLCNTLMATAGYPQERADGWVEPPLVTSGDDLKTLHHFLGARSHYAAADVIDYLLGGSSTA